MGRLEPFSKHEIRCKTRHSVQYRDVRFQQRLALRAQAVLASSGPHKVSPTSYDWALVLVLFWPVDMGSNSVALLETRFVSYDSGRNKPVVYRVRSPAPRGRSIVGELGRILFGSTGTVFQARDTVQDAAQCAISRRAIPAGTGTTCAGRAGLVRTA